MIIFIDRTEAPKEINPEEETEPVCRQALNPRQPVRILVARLSIQRPKNSAPTDVSGGISEVSTNIPPLCEIANGRYVDSA